MVRFFKIKETDQVIQVRLARGEKYNALDGDMLKEFVEVLHEVTSMKAAIVLLSGEGEGFCAGGDISMMKQIGDAEKYREVMTSIEKVITTIYTMPKVVISAIHGPAVGLGLSIALACDYVMAEKHAKISMNFIGIGLAPDGGGHFWLEQRMGTQKAKKLAWEGIQLNGEEAYHSGLIDEVVDDSVHQAAEALALNWCKRPLRSMIASKQIYHQYHGEHLLHYLEKERVTQWNLLHTDDHREGVQAFFEKRKPVFKGN